MKREEDNLPRVGDASGCLGVRPGEIPVDDAGDVHPGTKGMSVSPSIETLPEFLLPRRFAKLGFPGAAGSNNASVWCMGDGEFTASAITSDLRLRADPKAPKRHGYVEPSQPVPLTEYETALANTRTLWKETNE